MKFLAYSLLILLFGMNLVQAAPEENKDEVVLPSDTVTTPEVIYKKQFSLAKVTELNLSYSSLYGDKYLSTQGVLIEGRHHFTESWGLGLGVGFYKSSTGSEYSLLAGTPQEPFIYDPKLIIKATAVFTPIYGKILVGSKIMHFRIDGEFGLHSSKEQSKNIGFSPSFSKIGPIVGVTAIFNISEKFLVSTGTDLLIAGASPYESFTGARKMWLFNLGVGFRF